MLAIAVLVGEVIALGTLPPASLIILLSLLVPIFSEMGSFALNDYLDVETDRINKRKDRPLVTGEISPQFAFRFSLVAILLSVIFAYFINIYAFGIALVFNALAIAYNYRLKDMPLVGNLYIGTTMGIPFLFGSSVITNSLQFSITIQVLAALGFLAGVAREIIKSIEDVEGDKKARKSRTLPVIIGEKRALYLACLIYLIFIPLTALPFLNQLKLNYLAVGLVISADIGILIIVGILLKQQNKHTFKMARNLSLFCLFLGLLAYLIAAVG